MRRSHDASLTDGLRGHDRIRGKVEPVRRVVEARILLSFTVTYFKGSSTRISYL